MRWIVARCLPRPLCGLYQRSEGHEPVAHRKGPAEACVLEEDRFSGSQVTSAAVAEPAAVCLNVNGLSRGELAARKLDVASEAVRIGRCDSGIDEPPAVPAQQLDIRLHERVERRRIGTVRQERLGSVEVEGDLEALLHAVRELGKVAELVRLEAERPACGLS